MAERADEYCPRCDRMVAVKLEVVERVGYVTVCGRCATETEQPREACSYHALGDWTAAPKRGAAPVRIWDGDVEPKTAWQMSQRIGWQSVVPGERCAVAGCGGSGKWSEGGVALCREHRARYLYHQVQYEAQGLRHPRTALAVLDLAERAIKDGVMIQESLFERAA